MRKYLLVICMLIITNARAQYAGYQPLANTETFRQQFARATQSVRSISCDFVQEKNLSMLTDKIISTGKFWYKKDSKVRMEYEKPTYYLLVINGGMIKTKDGQKENKVSAKSNKMFEQVNRMVIDCVRGTVFDNKAYDIKVFENTSSYLVELSPTGKSMQGIFKSINLVIDKKDYSIIKMDMREKSGDNTTIKMLHKQINTNIPDALFAI